MVKTGYTYFVIIILTLLLHIHRVFGQSDKGIQGLVVDTVSSHVVSEATVTLLAKSDSMLCSFTYSDYSGKFSISKVLPNEYILIVSKAGYIDFIDTVKFTSNNTPNIVIGLLKKSIMIEEVLVNKHVEAVTIRGDTTEYNVDKFNVPKNASIEEMLKILPGMEVDRQGSISVNGQNIQKVLVDGEEFFSDDYTLVTKNLKSRMIQKVQVYDKKSSFSSEKTKVVDLKLKEDSKNGLFGKAVTGGGLDAIYENQLMANRFKNKMKASIYGTLSNSNLIGLGGKNREIYNEGIDETISFNVDLDPWDGNYNGLGLPRNASIGTHFSNRFDQEKQYLNINYKLSALHLDVAENTVSEINLPNDKLYVNNSSTADYYRLSSNFKGNYEIKVDSSSVFKLEISASANNKEADNNYESHQLNANLDTINVGFRHTNSDTKFKRLLLNTNFEKYIFNPRRILGITYSQNIIDQASSGHLYSDYRFTLDSQIDSTLNLDQARLNNSQSRYYRSKIYYTEPIHKYVDLTFNYGLDLDNNKSRIESYNLGSNTTMVLDSIYSGSYNFDRVTNRAGISALYKKGRLRLLVASDIGDLRIRQKDLFNSDEEDRSFFYVYPKASVVYSFSQQRSIQFSFDGDVVQPSMQQLQPVVNNVDPLNIVVGNTELAPFYKQSFHIAYNDYIPATKRHFFSNFTLIKSDNPIGLDIFTDPTSGQSSYEYKNFGTSIQYNGYVGVGKRFNTENETFAGLNLNIDGFKNNVLLNNQMIDSRNTIFSTAVYGNKDFKGKLYVGVNLGVKYNTNQTGVNVSNVGNFWQYNFSGNVNIELPLDFTIAASTDYDRRQKNSTFNKNVDVLVISPSISKKFLREKNLMLKISGDDVLNQRIGFSRYLTQNSINQRTYNTLGRYYLISLIWDFTKIKKIREDQ